MNASESDPFARRFRLLLAQEFASRGYLLDAEGFFKDQRMEDMSTAELDLLARVAALRGDWSNAERRSVLLAETSAEMGQRSQAQELAAYAREQNAAPPSVARQPCERRCRWWLVLLTAIAGAAVAVLSLWLTGRINWPH